MTNKKLHIKSCPSPKDCKYAVTDGTNLKALLQANLTDLKLPAKVKIAISTCSMCCTMPKVRDVGFVATKKGWELYFGGNAGGKPRIADCISKQLTTNQAADLAKKLLQNYCDKATPKMRTSTYVERNGINTLKADL